MSDAPRKLGFHERARTLPNKSSYQVSILWTLLLYLILICIVAAGAGVYLNPIPKNTYLLLGLAASLIPVWLFSFFSRKRASCPLCKGTPLLDSQASKHVKAVKIFPLNYGHTNIIRAVVTQRMRCHFCGTPYDLLKKNLTPRPAEQMQATDK